MRLTNWFLNFDFKGRARRSHAWANFFAWAGAMVALMIGVRFAPVSMGAVFSLLFVAALIGSMIDGAAMTFRRAHDTGKSGLIWFLLFIPLVNLLPMYWLLIQDSDQGPNKYGPPVKRFYVAPAT